MTRIGIVPRVHGVGGMVSFRDKLTAGLQKRGIEVSMTRRMTAMHCWSSPARVISVCCARRGNAV